VLPIFAARAADGRRSSSTKLAIHKSLPFRVAYRTLRVDPEGALLFDSRETDSTTHSASRRLLGRSPACDQWELLLLSAAGRRERRSIVRASKHLPLSLRAHRTRHPGRIRRRLSMQTSSRSNECGRLLRCLPKLERSATRSVHNSRTAISCRDEYATSPGRSS